MVTGPLTGDIFWDCGSIGIGDTGWIMHRPDDRGIHACCLLCHEGPLGLAIWWSEYKAGAVVCPSRCGTLHPCWHVSWASQAMLEAAPQPPSTWNIQLGNHIIMYFWLIVMHKDPQWGQDDGIESMYKGTFRLYGCRVASLSLSITSSCWSYCRWGKRTKRQKTLPAGIYTKQGVKTLPKKEIEQIWEYNIIWGNLPKKKITIKGNNAYCKQVYTYDSEREKSGEKDKTCHRCDRACDIESHFNTSSHSGLRLYSGKVLGLVLS